MARVRQSAGPSREGLKRKSPSAPAGARGGPGFAGPPPRRALRARDWSGKPGLRGAGRRSFGRPGSRANAPDSGARRPERVVDGQVEVEGGTPLARDGEGGAEGGQGRLVEEARAGAVGNHNT